MSQNQTCPVCLTEYRVTWLAMPTEHDDSQTCFCCYILVSWTGRQTARFDVIDKYGAAKLGRSKSH